MKPHTMLRKTLMPSLLILLAAAASLSIVTPARATQPSGLSTEYILSPLPMGKSTFDQLDIFAKTDIDPSKKKHFWLALIATKGSSDLYVVRNTFSPGGTTGWHTHPGPSLITVTQGTITVYEGTDPTCTPHVYPAGSTFIDEGGKDLHLLRNETGVDAITVAVQLVPTDATRRIDKPNPGFCPDIN